MRPDLNPLPQNVDSLPSPSLLVYPDRIAANIQLMLDIAGGPERLRPHVKTHKMAEVASLQIARGITQFKCATLSEVALLTRCGADDLLLAMQPAGPTIERFAQTTIENPNIRYATLVDNLDTLESIERECVRRETRLDLYLDLNCGMDRTGIKPGDEALTLCQRIAQSPSVRFAGLHAYDGHIREWDPIERADHCNREFQSVDDLASRLEAQGTPVPAIVAGGSPTFRIHAQRTTVELSPGTTLLWDFGYGDAFPDLPFQHAALLLTRVISKPAPGLLCFDLGHKAVASEMPHPRARLLGVEVDAFVSQSEEHLVVQSSQASTVSVGDAFLAIPKHICPTVALHNKAIVVTNGAAAGSWTVGARDRILD